MRITKRGGSLIGYGILTGLLSVVSIGAVTQVGGWISSAMKNSQESIAVQIGGGCSSFADATEAVGSIVEHACHFETSAPLAGGWTIVAAQYETDPVPSWSGSAYPSGAGWSESFAVSEGKIPAHRHMAFGRRLVGGSIEIIDAVAVKYVTGDISRIGAEALTSIVDGTTEYDVHRNASSHWANHDPDEGVDGSGGDYDNTLTIDLREEDPSNIPEATWAFSPARSSSTSRGYSYQGGVVGTAENFAWIVLVR